MIGRAFPLAPRPSIRELPKLSFAGSGVSTSDLSSYSISVNCGTKTKKSLIIAVTSNGPITSVSVGGVAATIVVSESTPVIWVIPNCALTGVQTVVVESSSTRLYCGVTIVEAVGLHAPLAPYLKTWGDAPDDATISPNVLKNSVGIAGVRHRRASGSPTWVGLTQVTSEIIDASVNIYSTVAIGDFTATETPRTITCTLSGTPISDTYWAFAAFY